MQRGGRQACGSQDLGAVEPWAGSPCTDQKRQEYILVCALTEEADLEKRAQVREAGKSHLPSAFSQGSPFHRKFRPLLARFLWEGWGGTSYSRQKGRCWQEIITWAYSGTRVTRKEENRPSARLDIEHR